MAPHLQSESTQAVSPHPRRIGELAGLFLRLGTTGMFLPAFFFVAVSAPFVPRLRRSPLASSVLDGLNVGSLALMLAVTLLLARSTLVDLSSIALALGSLVVLVWLRLNSTWLVAAGFLLGILFFH
jgi:chromate transporter